MLWKDENVSMSVMTAPGGMKRLLGDLPFVLSVARGTGAGVIFPGCPR
jgi:hypothetical protein